MNFNPSASPIDIVVFPSPNGAGFIDVFRYYNPDTIKYTWWSFMGNARAKNIGWRIDYFVCSKDFIDKVKNPQIHDDIMGSDHCPISIEVKAI